MDRLPLPEERKKVVPGMISIIIPIYNKGSNIGRCIESVQNQICRDIEILLVDDGSTDNSLDVCKKYAARDSRIFIIEKENGGVSSARNAGIKAAKGEYIQFVDADDYIHPEMSSRMLKQLVGQDAQLAVCGFLEKKRDGSEVVRKPEKQITTGVSAMETYVKGLFQNCFIQSSCNKLYLREYISNMFQKDYSYGEDLLFNLEYLKGINKVTFVPEAYYIYDNENSGDSLTSNYRKNEIDIRIHLLEASLEFCEIYLEGHESEKEISSKMMRAVIFSLFDTYIEQDCPLPERKNKIKGWIINPVIQKAGRICQLEGKQQKICNFLICKKWTNLLFLLFWMKQRLHFYK